MKMLHYCADEFIRNTQPDTIGTVIDKKMNLLKDFCILKDNDYKKESTLRKVLAQYNSEYDITVALHDIILGRQTLDDFLAQKGAH